jgi:menaquinone-9 beta-reductase
VNHRNSNPVDARIWDVIIIGAGVAGASSAILCAQQGLTTLLLEAKAFPREKVCGGCLNQRAQQSLARLGVAEQLLEQGAISIDRFRLCVGRLQTNWKIPRLISIRRSTMDMQLVQAAVGAGACFRDQTKASVEAFANPTTSHRVDRTVLLKCGADEFRCRAKVVIVADGLTRSSLSSNPAWRSQVEADSRIGVQKLACTDHVSDDLLKSTLMMQVHKQGYVGISRTDGNRLNFAAAIAPESLRAGQSIDDSIRTIMGLGELSELATADPSRWLATPSMTRESQQVADERLFLLGDSIGYVEPFTGEGMSWALASAESVIPFVKETIAASWSPRFSDQWTAWVRSQRLNRQKTCRWIARQLRKPSRAAWVVRLCDVCPPVRNAFLRKVCT